MENKTRMIITSLIEKLKKDNQLFEKMAVIETHGTYASRADIATYYDANIEAYSVIVIKHDNC